MSDTHYYLVAPLTYTGAAGEFTYHSSDVLEPGGLVTVPIGKRTARGIVTGTTPKPDFLTKPLVSGAGQFTIPPDLLELGNWLSSYYAASPSSVWSAMLPGGLDRKRRNLKDLPQPAPSPSPPAHPLTPEQVAALSQIRRSNKTTHLLQGITGSGKTRIYIELAAEAVGQGHSVVVLVPEITLTPQIVGRFTEAFGNLVLTSHSKLTEAQRYHIWSEAMASAAAGEPRIIIGPRSCLFMPSHSLRLIIVDECHEGTYKQTQNPRYNAVTTAAKRAQLTGARLVLGSATPGLTELFLAHETRLEHIILSQRANRIPRAQALIINLRDKDLLKSSKFITQPLIDAVSDTIQAGRQSLLYLNRRGSASSQICADCGQVTNCPYCRLPLTFHADLMRLICHHCNYRTANAALCPDCRGADLRLLGGGTKRIEAEIERLFPAARIARLDRDSATLAHIKAVLKGLEDHTIDILIGTQMIAKGLDLPSLDTVGIVNADTMLHLPDFTAAERTFQLLSQVSGRAGRGDRAGRVFIQTYSPGHPAIIAAANNSYTLFAEAELAERRQLNYPPFVYLLKLSVACPSRDAAVAESLRFCEQLRELPGIKIIGPAPAFIEQQASKYHWVLTVKAKNRKSLVDIATRLPSPRWSSDLDPVNLL